MPPRPEERSPYCRHGVMREVCPFPARYHDDEPADTEKGVRLMPKPTDGWPETESIAEDLHGFFVHLGNPEGTSMNRFIERVRELEQALYEERGLVNRLDTILAVAPPEGAD